MLRLAIAIAVLSACSSPGIDPVEDEPADCDPMATPSPGVTDICCEQDAPICAEWIGPDWASTECILRALCGGHCEGWYLPGSPCGEAGTCSDRGECIEPAADPLVLACDPWAPRVPCLDCPPGWETVCCAESVACPGSTECAPVFLCNGACEMYPHAEGDPCSGGVCSWDGEGMVCE